MASWFDDMSDTELHDLIPFFEKLSKVDNVYTVLRNANNHNQTAGNNSSDSNCGLDQNSTSSVVIGTSSTNSSSRLLLQNTSNIVPPILSAGGSSGLHGIIHSVSPSS